MLVAARQRCCAPISRSRRALFSTLPTDWLVHPELAPHLHHSVPSLDRPDSYFGLTFLGTSAGASTIDRGNTATVLKGEGFAYLVDAGEATQLQFMQSHLKMGDLRKVLVTHLHGDHVFGVLGLLLQLQHTPGYRGIEVYGPVGLYNFLAANYVLSGSSVSNIQVFELYNETRRYPPTVFQRAFTHRGIRRCTLPMNPDGTWTLEEANEIASEEDAILRSSKPSGLYVYAAEVDHVPQQQTLGYVFAEPTTLPLTLDIEKARDLGVTGASTAKYKLLKSGYSVQSDDGWREVQPEEVTRRTSHPRRVAILGDCCRVPQPMRRLCRGADVLVHEATFLESERKGRTEHVGHSSAAMAGRVAREVEARTLFLNHLGLRQIFSDELQLTYDEAVEQAGDTKVQLAYDFMELQIPRVGFGKKNEQQSS